MSPEPGERRSPSGLPIQPVYRPDDWDGEYARDLGFAAVTHLLAGGSGALVTIQGGEFTPIPFAQVLDPSGEGRRRPVDITTESYRVAREYMVRLGPRDFADAAWVAQLARAAGIDDDGFRARFGRFANAPSAEVEGR